MPASESKASEPKKLPGIFISYRRSDNPDAVGRIYDRLVSEFGKARVFKDVDSIPLGQDFRSHLNDIVGNCAAVLAIIGPRWVDTRNEAGQRRLEDPDDFVRIELEAALSRNVPVVPVLVGHAPIPGSSQLPASLASLAFRQSIEVRPDPDFHNDATRLVSALKVIVDPNAPVAHPLEHAKATAGPKPWRKFVWAIAIAGVLVPVVTTFGVPAVNYFRQPPPPETRLEISTPESDKPLDFALSPDGRQIAFVANDNGTSRLWVRSLASTTARPLPGTEGATAPFWSPDGRSVAFFAARSLKRLDLGGGQPQSLAGVGNGAVGAWGADDTILFVRGPANTVEKISSGGGEAKDATKLPPWSIPQRWPQFLPDGRRFLFVVTASANPATSEGAESGMYMAALDGKPPVRLNSNISRFAYLPSGWILWLRAGALVAQRLDIEKAALTGPIVTVADSVSAMSVAATGHIAYRTGESSKLQLKWVDRSGKILASIGEPDESMFSPRVAPDGRRIVFSRTAQGNRDIWLLDGQRASRLSSSAREDQFPVWSPDGTKIVYSSQQSRSADLYQKLANGAGESEVIPATGPIKFPSSWSADGKFLLYFSADLGTNLDMWVRPMTGDQKPYVFLKTPFTEVWGYFSPDGKWVAYQSDESGLDEVYIRAFVQPGDTPANSGAAGGQLKVSTSGGIHPVWGRDGKEIFYINPAGGMMAAPINVVGTTLVPGTPTLLFQSHVFNGGTDYATGRQYDVAPDGRFLINTKVDTGTPAAPIILIQNWNPDAGK
jgi:Tol biopolymer transport system component